MKYWTNQVYTVTNTYKNPGATTTSGQLLSQRVSAAGYDVTHSYTYDNNGNILSVSDGTYTTSYAYDSQNQLIRENNQQANKTWTWTYDAAGNILNRKEYAYTTGTLGTPTDTVNYTYGDADWGDLLTGYDGRTYTYDGIGNPLSDGVRTYTWEHGRRLLLLDEWELGYDGNGMRLERFNIDDGIWYTYHYNSSGQLVRMICDTEEWNGLEWYYADLTFTYDANGNPMTASYAVDYYDADEYIEHTGTFYYVTNAQGDVTALVDETGELLATYDYDAWGKPVRTYYYEVYTDYGLAEASQFVSQNPFRYRGYVYDTETGLYYLQSRYYDPEVGRFINADAFVATGQGLTGNNQFAYCGNNPVCRLDSQGYMYDWAMGRSRDGFIMVSGAGSGGGAAATAVGAATLSAAAIAVAEQIDDEISDLINDVERHAKAYARANYRFSQALRRELEKHKPVVHHIVPKGDYSTRNEETRRQLKELHELLSDKWISCKYSPVNIMLVSQEYHSSMHTDAYIARVYNCIMATDRSRTQIYVALYQLRMEISAEDPYSYLY